MTPEEHEIVGGSSIARDVIDHHIVDRNVTSSPAHAASIWSAGRQAIVYNRR